MTTGVFICLMLAFTGNLLGAIGHAKDRTRLQSQIDHLRAELEQTKSEILMARGEAHAALLAIREMYSKK